MACPMNDRRLSLVISYRLLAEDNLQARLIRSYYGYSLSMHSKLVFLSQTQPSLEHVFLEHT